MEKITDQELIDLIDNRFGVERSGKMLELINHDQHLLRRYQMMKVIHQHLSNSTHEEAPVSFSDRVMSNLHNPQYIQGVIAARYNSRNLFTFFTIFAGILVGVYILASGIVAIPFFDQFSINPVNLQGNKIDINPIIDGLTSSVIFKVFLIADMVLAWFILDRVVLKPYFETRRKKYAY